MTGRRIASLLCLLWCVLWAGTSIYGAVALPNANVFRVQGPDTTGLAGYPLAVVPATGSAAFPVGGSTTPADAASTPTAASQEQAFPMIYNGTTWDLLRSANAGQATTGTGVLGAGALAWDGTNFQRARIATPVNGLALAQGVYTNSMPYVYNGATLDLLASANQGQATTGTGVLGVGNLLWDGTNYQRWGMTTNVDAQTAAQNQGVVAARPSLYNGATFDRLRDANTGQNTTGTGVAGSANLVWDGTNYQRVKGVTLSGNTYQQDSLGTALAGEDLPNNILRVGGKGGGWSITHAPTVGTQATISQASGGVGVKNVCRAISFGIANDATGPTATILTVNLRDGASGAGTILHTWTLFAPTTVGYNFNVSLPGLWIEGSSATAMTLEFVAGLAHTLEYVNIDGCTLP